MKNMRIGARLFLGFGMVLLLVLLLGIVWQNGMKRQNRVESAQNDLLTLRATLREMQIAHYVWTDKLRDAVRGKSAFTGVLDPTQCAFGKWYYGYKLHDSAIESLFKQLEEPHRKLHEAGAAVVKAVEANRIAEADALSLNARQTILPHLMTVYNPFVEKIGEECALLENETQAMIRSQKQLSTGVMALAMLLVVVLGWYIASTITKPIKKVVARANRVAEGVLSDAPLAIDAKDETGVLGGALNLMQHNLRDAIKQVATVAMQASSSAEQMAAMAEEMASGAEEQTTQTAQVAASAEEMSATLQEIAQNTSRASDRAKNAGEIAARGGTVVDQSTEGMNRIAHAVAELQTVVQGLSGNSEKIGNIIEVIDDLADQTNLLALNAAIEAARAGEQGRGFAVVADEVRKLAERTTVSTKEISAMVKNIQADTAKAVKSMTVSADEVANGVKLTGQAGETLKAIVVAVKSVEDMIHQIATASEEQSRAVQEVSSNIETIASVSKQNSTSAQQTSVASQDISKLTEDLQQLVNKFKLEEGGGAASAASQVKLRRLKTAFPAAGNPAVNPPKQG